MHTSIGRGALSASVFLVFAISALHAQSAGTIYGTVVDPIGAVLPNASVTIENPVSHYTNKTTRTTPATMNSPISHSIPIT